MAIGTRRRYREKGLPKPPDGGWGWVVVFSSFMIHVIADGVTYTFGIFYVELLKHFGSGTGLTAWVPSIMTGMTYGIGPVASGLTNRYGCRAVTIAGALLASLGLILSLFAPNVITLFFTIGICAGTGFGLIYLPAIVSVTCYFEKKRAFATGIAVCGSGIGSAVFAPLTEWLIQVYGWKGAMLIVSAIILNCCFFGALFRPLSIEEEDDSDSDSDTGQKEEEREKLDVGQIDGTEMKERKTLLVKSENNSDYKYLQANGVATLSPSRHSFCAFNTQSGGGELQTVMMLAGPGLKCKDKFDLDQEEDKDGEDDHHHQRHNNLTTSRNNCDTSDDPNYVYNNNETNRLMNESCKMNGFNHKNVTNTTTSTTTLGKSNKLTSSRSKGTLISKEDDLHHLRSPNLASSGLLYRKDIFYSASLINLPQYRSNPVLYNASMSSLTSLDAASKHQVHQNHSKDLDHRHHNLRSHHSNHIEDHAVDSNNKDTERPQSESSDVESEKSGFFGCSKEMKDTFREMMDFELLKNPVFLLFTISNLLTSFGYYVPHIYIKHRTLDLKIASDEEASNLLGVIGIASTVGRVLFGYLSDHLRSFNRLWLYNTCLTICGLSTVLSVMADNYFRMALYCAVFGLTCGAYVSLTSVILVDLLGLEKLTNAFGLLLLFQGVACLVGPPIVGWLYDFYGSYNPGFGFAGVILAISGLMLFFTPLVASWDQRRQMSRNNMDAKPPVVIINCD